LGELRKIIDILIEGGLKMPPEHRTTLNPSLVKLTCSKYVSFMEGWNSWLRTQGVEPITLIGPSGSSTYAEQDLITNPTMTYGDVDYLVSIPVKKSDEAFGERRKKNAETEKLYVSLLQRFIGMKRDPNVDSLMTLKGSPLQVIINVDSSTKVQVDTVITFSESAEWMKGRYTPERGVKGYVTGNLYKALGDYLSLSIGTEGVLVRTKDGARVGSNVRAGVVVDLITNDFKRFMLDISRYLAPNTKPSQLLTRYPGLDPNAINIGDLSKGIVGLAQTLEQGGIVDAHSMLTSIHSNFVENLEKSIARKESRDLSREKLEQLKQLNTKQSTRVRNIFNV
jgi:hypothetical protein